MNCKMYSDYIYFHLWTLLNVLYEYFVICFVCGLDQDSLKEAIVIFQWDFYGEI